VAAGRHATAQTLPFPVLLDPGQRPARQAGAGRTLVLYGVPGSEAVTYARDVAPPVARHCASQRRRQLCAAAASFTGDVRARRTVVHSSFG